jgi:hypothetical protein
MTLAAILLFLLVAFLTAQVAQRWGPFATV